MQTQGIALESSVHVSWCIVFAVDQPSSPMLALGENRNRTRWHGTCPTGRRETTEVGSTLVLKPSFGSTFGVLTWV